MTLATYRWDWTDGNELRKPRKSLTRSGNIRGHGASIRLTPSLIYGSLISNSKDHYHHFHTLLLGVFGLSKEGYQGKCVHTDIIGPDPQVFPPRGSVAIEQQNSNELFYMLIRDNYLYCYLESVVTQEVPVASMAAYPNSNIWSFKSSS